jgi:hypothetical protein
VFDRSAESTKIPVSELNNFPDKQVIFTLKGPWIVSFDTIMGGPENIEFKELADWSKSSEDGIKFYSGKAVYSNSFDLPDSVLKDRKTDIYLDLGVVKNLASVTLNDKYLGVIWTSPWQVKISDVVREKDNRLKIAVANLWVNRLIGDEYKQWDGIENGKWPEWLLNGTKRPSDRYTFTTYRRYKKDDPLMASGLLGPVTVMNTIKPSSQGNPRVPILK